MLHNSHATFSPTLPRMIMTACLLLVMLTALAPTAALAQPAAAASSDDGPTPEANINLTLIASGLNRPVYVTSAPADRSRLFIIEKLGRIRIYKNNALLPTPFIDIQSVVRSSGNEQGLLSMAFHPNYASNGYFYVYYTNLSGNPEIARYSVTANPDIANPSSALILLTIPHPTYTNHNGGQLQFGPDGYLYLGTGDGGSGGDPANNSQNTGVLLGKMLRLDVDGGTPYAIPPSNPFVGPGNPRDEIWSLGLRNPWRFSFDRLNGDLWIGDVGQDAWEEIDREPANSAGGLNWGWDCYEGTHAYQSNPSLPYCTGLTFTWPVYELSHSSAGVCSITGGYVYRGSPNSTYFGDYLFADYCVSNRVWALRYNGSSWVATQHTLVPPTGQSMNYATSFGQDAYGDLYMADDTGEVFKIALRPAQCVSGNYDVNGDGQVDIVDVQLVASDFMRLDFVPDYDVNCSGAVDTTDITLVAAAW